MINIFLDASLNTRNYGQVLEQNQINEFLKKDLPHLLPKEKPESFVGNFEKQKNQISQLNLIGIFYDFIL